MIIKVCGMREATNIRLVEQLPIDWMGFIFYHKSPRYVKDIPSYLPTQVKRVGVFVDSSIDFIAQHAIDYNLDFLQLHGHETPEQCYNIQQLTKKKIIKAFGISNDTDFECLSAYEQVADYFLFDSRCDTMGGSGKSFNHLLLKKYTGKTPFLLSGGLGLENIHEITSFKHPLMAGIDLNSRFEISPGVKSVERLQEFINKYNQQQN